MIKNKIKKRKNLNKKMSHSMSFNDKTYDTQVSNQEPETVFIGKEGKPNFT